MKLRVSLLPLLLAASPFAFAGTITVSGTLVDAPLFQRPSTVSLTSVTSAQHRYQAWEFSVDTAGSYAMGTVSPILFDAFIILYQSPFDPLSPLTNALSAADGNGALIDGVNTSDRIVRNLDADILYTLVVTTFSASATPAAYQAIFSGPGAIDVCATGVGCNSGGNGGGGNGDNGNLNAIPEPSTALLLIAGFAVSSCLRRKRR
jgi:hypothetical protein